MIKVDCREGIFEVNSSNVELLTEIQVFIKEINSLLDSKPLIIKDSILETIVQDDDTYKEICKFSFNMKKARERIEYIKSKHPDLFTNDGEIDTEKMLEEIANQKDFIAEFLDKILK